MISPGRNTPVEMASAPESPVPTSTGVPSARPVCAAALAVTVPAMSVALHTWASWSGRQYRPQCSSSTVSFVKLYSGAKSSAR